MPDEYLGAVTGLRWLLSWVLDALLYACVCAPRLRSFTRPDITIVHFVVVPLATDLMVLGVPPRYRIWTRWFRLAVAAQLGTLQVALWLYGFDADLHTLLATLACAALVVFDTAWTIAVSTQFFSVSRVRWFAITDLLVARRGWLGALMDFASATAFILVPSFFANTHNMWGDARLDGPLTGFQATDAPAALWKLLVAELLVDSRGHKFVAALVFFAALAVQWPLMPQMFLAARVPLLHIGAEIGLLTRAVKHAQRLFRA